jgi:hypothetical protein
MKDRPLFGRNRKDNFHNPILYIDKKYFSDQIYLRNVVRKILALIDRIKGR